MSAEIPTRHEQQSYHRNNLSLHFPNARENIRMDGIGNTKLPKRLSLELQQIFTTMINGATDTTILPTSMLQAGQLIKLLADFIRRPTFLGECQIPVHIRTALHKLRLKVPNSRGHLLIDLAAYTGRTEEEGVTKESDGDIDVA